MSVISTLCCVEKFYTLWKLRDFTARGFRKTSVKLSFYKSTLLQIDLTEKNLRGSEFFIFPHCKTRRSLFLRKNQHFSVKSMFTKELISRNFFA